MPLLSQKYATGFEPIDAEHRDLILLLERLVEAVKSGELAEIGAATTQVVEKVAAHFAHEERLMRESGYSQLAPHKEAHDLFLADAGRFLGELLARGLTPDFRRWAMGRVIEWFGFHIIENDMPLGQFLLGRERTAQTPGAARDAEKYKPN